MKRKYVAFHQVPAVMGCKDWDELNSTGWDLWENMGWCKDGTTRWYWFTDIDGIECYTLKF